MIYYANNIAVSVPQKKEEFYKLAEPYKKNYIEKYLKLTNWKGDSWKDSEIIAVVFGGFCAMSIGAMFVDCNAWTIIFFVCFTAILIGFACKAATTESRQVDSVVVSKYIKNAMITTFVILGVFVVIVFAVGIDAISGGKMFVEHWGTRDIVGFIFILIGILMDLIYFMVKYITMKKNLDKTKNNIWTNAINPRDINGNIDSNFYAILETIKQYSERVVI